MSLKRSYGIITFLFYNLSFWLISPNVDLGLLVTVLYTAGETDGKPIYRRHLRTKTYFGFETPTMKRNKELYQQINMHLVFSYNQK